jgi:quinol monooxygenase YgiN
MADFVHELDIAASPDRLRKLIAERGDAWWTTNALIDSQVGGSCEFRFPAAGFHASVRVMRNSEDSVMWYCLDSASPKSSGFKNLHDWIGSKITFRLAPAASGTRLRLDHQDLGESAEFYNTGFNVWAYYLDSLKKLAETGVGAPYQGGRPGTRTAGLVAKTVSFRVKPGQIATAEAAIVTFIDNIERHEPDTLAYRSYRDVEDPNSFTHTMLFKDADAYARHRDSAYCAAFVRVLYPCCEALPRAVGLSLFREAAVGVGAGAPAA